MNATLGNEFATVGYRAHSQIHGEFEIETELSTATRQAQLDALEAQGLEVAIDGDEIEIAIPLNVAFFNPDLLELVQLGPMLQGLGLEAQYKNDEQIDNQLRSVLFQIPVAGQPGVPRRPELPECFTGVVDLGAIDIERGRDHGMPSYNQLRQAYGLPAEDLVHVDHRRVDRPVPGRLAASTTRTASTSCQLRDIDGDPIDLDDEDAVEGTATSGVRRSTVAARLRAIYGNVNNIDAFVGMVAEAHVPGTEFGELQLAIWKRAVPARCATATASSTATTRA